MTTFFAGDKVKTANLLYIFGEDRVIDEGVEGTIVEIWSDTSVHVQFEDESLRVDVIDLVKIN